MSDLEAFFLALGLILFLMICIGFWDTYKNDKRIRKWLHEAYHHHFSSQYNKLYHSSPDDSAIIIIQEHNTVPYNNYNFPFPAERLNIDRNDLSNFLAEFYKLQSNASHKILYIIGKGFCGWLAIRAAQYLTDINCPKFLRLLAIQPDHEITYLQTSDNRGFTQLPPRTVASPLLGKGVVNGNQLVHIDPESRRNWVVYTAKGNNSIYGEVAMLVPINQNLDTQILNTFFNRFNHVAIVITTDKDNSLQSLVKPYVSQIVEFTFPSENLANCLTKFKETYNELQNKTNLPIVVIGCDIGGWFAIRAVQFICSEIYHPVVHVMAVNPYSSEYCTCQYRYNDDNGKNGFVLHIQQEYPLLAQNDLPDNQGPQITPVDQRHWHVYSNNATTQSCYQVVATVHNESNTMCQDFFAQVKEEKNVRS